MLKIVPTNFNSKPKPNSYYSFTEMSHKSEQNLLAVPVLKLFGAKLPVHLLCTVINTSPDDVTLPKNQHIGEMKPLSNRDDSWHSPSVNEVTHDTSSNHIDIQYPKTDSFPSIM